MQFLSGPQPPPIAEISRQAARRYQYPVNSNGLYEVTPQHGPLKASYQFSYDTQVWRFSYCSSCDTEKTLKSGVQDTTLFSKFSGYEFVDDGSVIKLSIDRDIDEHYTGYTLSGHLIHGIGFVHTRYLHPNDEETVTTIRWKNKFVAQDIEDEYPTCFGVNYH